MGGVDQYNNYCNNVATGIRSKKWTWTVFCRFIQAVIINATDISNRVRNSDGNKKGSLKFMIAIGHYYLDNPKSLSNKVHKKVHSEQKKVCSINLCPIRTNIFCQTCNKFFCKTCHLKNH